MVLFVPKILIVSCGLGGHFLAAKAVIEKLDSGFSSVLVGDKLLEEKQIVPGSDFYLLKASGFRGKGIFKKFYSCYFTACSFFSAYFLLKKEKPDVVLSMGGYVSIPCCLAAFVRRIPIIIHEQNSKVGLANKILSKIAFKKLQAFDGAFKDSCSAITVGNPIRSCVLEIPKDQAINKIKNKLCVSDDPGRLNILILGGSSGSIAINRVVCQAWENLNELDRASIWHQAGFVDYDNVKKMYANKSIEARVDAFIVDIAKAYMWADLIVCRCGAITVTEIAHVGIASIFVPYPHSIDNHQYYNARLLARRKAAFLITQDKFTSSIFAKIIKRFLVEPDSLLRMTGLTSGIFEAESAGKIIKICEDACHG